MQYEVVTSRMGVAFELDRNERWMKGADEDLEEKVSRLISEGWKPLGGVSMIVLPSQHRDADSHSVLLSQAMIKE